MGLLAVAVVVAAAGWIGHTLAGRRGTAWAAIAAAVLVANPMIGTTEINAELLGAPLTLVSIGCLLAAVRPPVRRPLGWRRTLLVALAGTAGAGAMLVKQNLMDALVFASVLARDRARWPDAWPWARSRRVLVLGLAGALLPIGADRGLGRHRGTRASSQLWNTLYAFRFDASHAIGSVPSPANDARRLTLGWLAVISGIAVVVAVGGATLWRPLRGRDPLVVATGAMVGWEVVGILGGGSYLVALPRRAGARSRAASPP